MTMNQKSPGKSTPAANREPISIQAEIDDSYEEVVAEPAASRLWPPSRSPLSLSRSKRLP
jgi:hypothetical protein